MQPGMCKSPLIVVVFIISRVSYVSRVYDLVYIWQFVFVNYYNLKDLMKKKVVEIHLF